MRIIGGRWRGRRLASPPGRGTRPTADRVREAIFSSIYSLLGALDDLTVIDLYAGSGALGFEALSREASRCIFVESDRRAAGTIAANARDLGLPSEATAIITSSAGPELGTRLGSVGASLLLADPPYRIDAAAFAEVLSGLSQSGTLAPGALVVYEHAAATDGVWPDGFEALSERRYGDTGVSFARYEGTLES
jgi:16S rRNA (guanine966-N2)-methyltransferase